MNGTTLTITIDDKGCRVEGPIEDKFTCYAMLELARDAIKGFSEGTNGISKTPLIVPATPGLRIT